MYNFETRRSRIRFFWRLLVEQLHISISKFFDDTSQLLSLSINGVRMKRERARQPVFPSSWVESKKNDPFPWETRSVCAICSRRSRARSRVRLSHLSASSRPVLVTNASDIFTTENAMPRGDLRGYSGSYYPSNRRMNPLHNCKEIIANGRCIDLTTRCCLDEIPTKSMLLQRYTCNPVNISPRFDRYARRRRVDEKFHL